MSAAAGKIVNASKGKVQSFSPGVFNPIYWCEGSGEILLYPCPFLDLISSAEFLSKFFGGDNLHLLS